MRTIKNLFKQDKEKFVPPKSVQDTIPIQTIYKDGIFQVGKNKYSKCYKFTDINFKVITLKPLWLLLWHQRAPK